MKKIFNYILFCGVTLFLATNSIFAAGRQCVYCGGSVDESLGIPVGIPNFISSLIKVAKILVPIILIVSAMIRYAKEKNNNIQFGSKSVWLLKTVGTISHLSN